VKNQERIKLTRQEAGRKDGQKVAREGWLILIGRLAVREGKKWLRFMAPNFTERLGEKGERTEGSV